MMGMVLISVPADAVVFYPQWYFSAWMTGFGLAVLAIGIILGWKLCLKYPKEESD